MTVDGRNEPANANTAPTWIGAIAAITESPVPITVEADGPCRVAIVPRDDFIALALEHRSVHRKVMHVIGPVMRGINQRESSRERLTSLGTMAAGLAHELNNPAAAARRAASDLVDAVEVINHALRAFVESGIERADAEKLLRLQQEALGMCIVGARLDALDASDAEDAMLDALEDRGIEDGWRFAEPLAAVGLDADWVDRVQAIAGPATGKTLAWVAASLTAHELATELVESTERMSGLVKAIKTYAYMDRGGVVQADVHEGLESTLVMLGHKLKHTQIKVKRDYDKSLPQLMMYGSELNQVWTNLLDNAIGALGENGADPDHDEPRQRLHQGRHRRRRARHPGRGAHAHLRSVLHHQGPGQRHGHGPGHRAAHRRTAPLRLDLVRHRRRRHDLPRLAAPRWSEEMTQCTHLDTIEITELPDEVAGCEDCLADRRRLAAPADLPRLRPRRLLRRLAQQARDRARLARAPDHPLAGAGRGLVLVLRGSGRDADPAGHRVDANSALADAVALNSASAAASTRPSLWAGPVSCTPTGRPSSSKPTGTAADGRPGEVLRHGVGQDGVAEALRADAAQLRRRARGSASAAGRRRRTRARSPRGCARGWRSPRRTPRA